MGGCTLTKFIFQCCIIRVTGQGMYILSGGTADLAMCCVQGTRVQLLPICGHVQCCATVFGLDMYYNCTPGVSVGNVCA